MARKARPGAVLALLLTLFVPTSFGCSLVSDDATGPEIRGPELVPDQPAPAPTYPAQAIVDRSLWTMHPEYAENAPHFADRDLVVMQMRSILSEGGAENVRRIRQVNPDVVVLGSVQMLSIVGHWNSEWHRPRLTLGARLWDITHDRPVRTTTGDVALMWTDMPMLNPMRDGRLDEPMLDAIVDAIVDHFEMYPGIADGIMHDYTSESPWIFPSPQIANIGEVDLDQDGVPFGDDPAEQQIWVAWQEELLTRLQDRMGAGFIQIANGRMAIERPSTARLLAGVWFQDYPTLPWDVTPRMGFEQLLDLMSPDGLTPRRGRTWNLLAPATVEDLGDVDLRRAASILTGSFYNYGQSHTVLVPGDPEAVDLGPALSDLVRERLPDGGLRLVRQFRDGEVRVEFGANGQLVTASVPQP